MPYGRFHLLRGVHVRFLGELRVIRRAGIADENEMPTDFSSILARHRDIDQLTWLFLIVDFPSRHGHAGGLGERMVFVPLDDKPFEPECPLSTIGGLVDLERNLFLLC